MEITRLAFERSSGDSQQIGNEEIPTLNTPIGVFVSFRAKLITPHLILTLLIVMVEACLTSRLATSSLHEQFVNQLLDVSRMAGTPSWSQSLPAVALISERSQAEARNNPANKTESNVRRRVDRSIGWALV